MGLQAVAFEYIGSTTPDLSLPGEEVSECRQFVSRDQMFHNFCI
jgi:hypothetical protein